MDDAELRSELGCTHNSAFGWALSCCGGDHIAAEEALHDVYAMVLEGRVQFTGTSAFRTWLFGVIRVTALSQRRRSWIRSLILSRNADQVVPQEIEAAAAVMRISVGSARTHYARGKARLARTLSLADL